MNPRILRLDPRFPMVWRDPCTLQLGVDRPQVILHDVTRNDEVILSALRVGVTDEGLALVADEAGIAGFRMRQLLSAVGPALAGAGAGDGARVSALASALARSGAEARARSRSGVAATSSSSHSGGSPPLRGRTVIVDDRSEVGAGLRALLARLGARQSGEPDVVVLVSDWAPDLAEAAGWLRRDTAHLPVVFSDTEVRVGPFIWPGVTACVHCIESRRVDADAAWTAMIAQLMGRSAASRDPVTVASVLPLVARALLQGFSVPPAASAAVGEGVGKGWACPGRAGSVTSTR